MTDLPQTRQSLLVRLGRHSDAAWSEFLEVYEGAILRLCRTRGLQDADARDVTQEVLAAVHGRMASWDPDAARGSFRAWLLSVARNQALTALERRARRAGREVAHVGSDAEDVFPPAFDHESFDVEYRRALVDWATARVRAEVRDQTWQAFRRTALEGRSPVTVAAELGVPVGSVYTAKCRVVARIRARVLELEAHGAEPPSTSTN